MFIKEFFHGASVIVTDKCCFDCKAIQKVLGSETRVLLDIFHAINRIIKELPAPSRYKGFPCNLERIQQSVAWIFRQADDRVGVRKKLTPSRLFQMKALDSLILEIDALKGKQKLSSNNLTNAITNLKSHIEHGCTEYIPVGVVTS